MRIAITGDVFIYVLLDSSGSRRYVGKACDPDKRLSQHRKNGKAWAVAVEVLETCLVGDWPARERFWISHGRLSGWPLENITSGGDAPPLVGEVSEATRAKLRGRVPWLKGRHHTIEARERMSQAGIGREPWNKGKRLSPEHRVKLVAARKGKAPMKGKRHTPETRERMSQSARKPKSPEHRAKLAEICRRNGQSVRRDADGRWS